MFASIWKIPPLVDDTLELFYTMRDHEGITNTGVVIQADLYRSEKDFKNCWRSGQGQLCKGAYKEPPEVAYPEEKRC